MKNKLIAIISLSLIYTIAPAHAISKHYAAQLERSGCTEITANDGTCDINKTEYENHPSPQAPESAKREAAEAQTARSHRAKEKLSAEEMDTLTGQLKGKKLAAVSKIMASNGFKTTDNETWTNKSGQWVFPKTNAKGVVYNVATANAQ